MLNAHFPSRIESFWILQLPPHLGQIRYPWHGQAFSIAHIAVGISLHIHSLIHLRSSFPFSSSLFGGRHADSGFHVSRESTGLSWATFPCLHIIIIHNEPITHGTARRRQGSGREPHLLHIMTSHPEHVQEQTSSGKIERAKSTWGARMSCRGDIKECPIHLLKYQRT